MPEIIRKLLDWLEHRLGTGPDVPAKEVQVPSAAYDTTGMAEPSWLTLEQLRKATGMSAVRAQDWYPHLRAACMEFGITSVPRLAAFLAQVGHESGGFLYTREIWGPTAVQQRYEGRADLGNTRPGDGPRFRGRGLIQVTGRANYAAVAAGLGIDCVERPELLEQPQHAARSAAWWWTHNGCNEMADAEDFHALTRRINGGYNGLDDRLARWEQARRHVLEEGRGYAAADADAALLA